MTMWGAGRRKSDQVPEDMTTEQKVEGMQVRGFKLRNAGSPH